jgi:hypothetical protein
VLFSLDRAVELAREPANTSAIASFTKADWEKLIVATHTGVSVSDFNAAVKA